MNEYERSMRKGSGIYGILFIQIVVSIIRRMDNYTIIRQYNGHIVRRVNVL